MAYPPGVTLAAAPCPLGCASGASPVLRGHDRLHDLPGDFRLVRCHSCGLLRTDPRPTQDSMGHYYPDDYGPYLSTRIKPEGRPGLVRRVLRPWLGASSWEIPRLPPGRLLEVGCASGLFLEQMKRGGWSVEGLEFSDEAATHARGAGHRVHTGTIETVKDVSPPFDLIVGWMFLEHLHDPVRSLRILRDWAAPGGWLALSVPDAGSWEFRHFRSRWYALQLPHHLVHYTRKTIGQVLQRAGWRPQRILWQRNPKNTLYSLNYGWRERGWDRLAGLARDVADGRRYRAVQLGLGALFGAFRLSGRMNVWARR
jgi:SAM-dependent methyltransferase